MWTVNLGKWIISCHWEYYFVTGNRKDLADRKASNQTINSGGLHVYSLGTESSMSSLDKWYFPTEVNITLFYTRVVNQWPRKREANPEHQQILKNEALLNIRRLAMQTYSKLLYSFLAIQYFKIGEGGKGRALSIINTEAKLLHKYLFRA